MTNSIPRSRRWLLQSVGAGALAVLAGCNSDSDGASTVTDIPTTGATTTRTTTSDFSETTAATDTPAGTPTETQDDTTAPVIETFTAQNTDQGGETNVYLEGYDNKDLAAVRLSTPVDELTREQYAATVTIEGQLQGKPGSSNEIEGTLTDGAGNRTSKTIEQYVRKYNVLADRSVNLGAVYIPFAGEKLHNCLDEAEPWAGTYGDPIAPSAANRHIDQMQGFGITRLLFNFGEEDEDYARARTLLEDTELIDEIEFETFYVIHQALRRDRDLSADFEFVRDTMYDHPNYTRIDDRPVVTFWWMKTPLIADKYRSEIESTYGGFPEFVDFLRDELAAGGTDPFLVADLDDMAYGGYWKGNIPDIKLFDAVTNSTGGNLDPGARPSWEDRLTRMENIYQTNAELAKDYQVEFIPTVFPGFDDRANYCWGTNRLLDRRPNAFRELLTMADQYRTLDRINIHTWNGWAEGHQIEPGAFHETEYGTAYLEVVQDFQRGAEE